MTTIFGTCHHACNDNPFTQSFETDAMGMNKKTGVKILQRSNSGKAPAAAFLTQTYKEIKYSNFTQIFSIKYD